ncbi:HNH endonuclease [Colwellia sp. E2M01]|uniref:HNH endonuclease n=1 Tax=Colwellia sp. E2M01 TaxID=2841561 RepID=UPI001C0851A0|nr:HNH endonuclease [Colwellia sp. E2M01]MBU2872005.1 HNH endonuclease [Colwellia sp. E2M01]
MHFCPYLGKEVHEDNCSSEHIIPLSLGGVNGFEIPVDAETNKIIGSQIDGKLSNDFIIQLARGRLKTKGHSGKPVVPKITKATIEGKNNSVSLSFPNNQLHIFDPRLKADVYPESVTLSAKKDATLDIKFIAKVTLSAGYYFWSDDFEDAVSCDQLRYMLLHDNLNDWSSDDIFSVKFETLVLNNNTFLIHFIPIIHDHFPDETTIAFIPSYESDRLLVSVSVLGVYIGYLHAYMDAKKVQIKNGFIVSLSGGKIKLNYFDDEIISTIIRHLNRTKTVS